MSRRRADVGFTLMEIIFVLAVIGILVALLTPMIFTHIEDAKRAQAQHDANLIAWAIAAFVKDTGLPPYKNTTSAAKAGAFEPGDFECLYGARGGEFTTDTDLTTDDGATDTWTSAGGIQCQAASTVRDTIENHLINNAPAGATAKAYATAGKNAWRGPYLPRVPDDAWGRKFLVNIRKADPDLNPPRAVWVISAGPNGKLETRSNADAASTVDPGGDDVMARLK